METEKRGLDVTSEGEQVSGVVIYLPDNKRNRAEDEGIAED
jgi:hypothetical protein